MGRHINPYTYGYPERQQAISRRKPGRLPSYAASFQVWLNWTNRNCDRSGSSTYHWSTSVSIRNDRSRSTKICWDQASPNFAFRYNITHGGLNHDTNIKLIREDEDVVDVIVTWLYSGPEGSLATIPLEDRFPFLVRLHQFALKYGFVTLQNDIIVEFFILNRDGHFPPLPIIRRVFDEIGPLSMLASLMIGWYVFHLDKDKIPSVDDLEETPRFAARLARAYMEKLKGDLDDPFVDEPHKFFTLSHQTDTAEELLDVQSYDGD